MKTENRYYDIYPRVVPADTRSTVTIHPRFEHVHFSPDKTYQAIVYPAERYRPPSGDAQKADLVLTDGKIEVTHLFSGEQEQVLEILDTSTAEPTVRFRTLLYSVREDLYGRLPLKGDVHMHSFRSDGRESPGFVAAACRQIGLDFMALTDHGQYAPSIASQEAFANVALDLLILRGEEVHPPGNPVHMVNFGGDFSVNELIARDEKAYLETVRREEAKLEDLPEEVRHQFSSCVWVFDQIRSGNGLGIFCHPYWHVRHGYTPSGAVTDALFDRQPYDAYELLGGYARDAVDSNTLQVARYHEERIKGRQIPIVGVSDAHGCENADLFGWYYTLTFAEETTRDSIIAGIKELKSVAVEAIPGAAIRAYGPLRLVQYALFLINEVLPAHDELCREEGRLMLDHLAGCEGAKDALANLKGRCARLFTQYVGCR